MRFQKQNFLKSIKNMDFFLIINRAHPNLPLQQLPKHVVQVSERVGKRSRHRVINFVSERSRSQVFLQLRETREHLPWVKMAI